MLFIIYHAMSCHACSLSNYLTKFNLHKDVVLGLYDCEMGKPPFIEGCCANVAVLLDLVALVLDIVDVDVKKLLGVADDVEKSSEADMVGDCNCDVKVNDADGTSDVDHAGGCA